VLYCGTGKFSRFSDNGVFAKKHRAR